MMTKNEKSLIKNWFKKNLMMEIDENEIEKNRGSTVLTETFSECENTIKKTTDKFLKKYPAFVCPENSTTLFRPLLLLLADKLEKNEAWSIKIFLQEIPGLILNLLKIQFINQLQEKVYHLILSDTAFDKYSYDYRENLSWFVAENLADIIQDEESFEIHAVLPELLKKIALRENNILRFDQTAKHEIVDVLKKSWDELHMERQDSWIRELLSIELNKEAVIDFIKKLYTNSDKELKVNEGVVTSHEAFMSRYVKFFKKSICLTASNTYDVVYRLAYMDSILENDIPEKLYCSSLYGEAINQYASLMLISEESAIKKIEDDVKKNIENNSKDKRELETSIQKIKKYEEQLPAKSLEKAATVSLAAELKEQKDAYYFNHHYKESEKKAFSQKVVRTINNASFEIHIPVSSTIWEEWINRIKSFFSKTFFGHLKGKHASDYPLEEVKRVLER